MADTATRKKPRVRRDAARREEETEAPAPVEEAARATDAAPEEESERQLALLFARGLPIAGLAGAIVIGGTVGLAPGILVLAGTALLGTIGFLWASLRTLSGDAPLPEGVAAHSYMLRTPTPERKRETLRALKDLELEHSVGKIDDADFQELQARYRGVAKTLMREMDEDLAPRRKRAEELVAAYLAKKNIEPPSKEDAPLKEEAPEEEAAEGQAASDLRLACAKCGVSNETDAAFCKKCGSPLTSAPPATETPDASV